MALGKAIWFARIAYAAVFVVNVSCALGFIAIPESYAGAYQLDGPAGIAAVRGIGVTFLMWNATYPLFIWKPERHMPLGAVVLAQQGIGLIGESFILSALPAGYETLGGSIVRFIGFDAAGLVLMAASFYVLSRSVRKAGKPAETGGGTPSAPSSRKSP